MVRTISAEQLSLSINCKTSKNYGTNFGGGKGYHRKEHVKRSRIVQISAP